MEGIAELTKKELARKVNEYREEHIANVEEHIKWMRELEKNRMYGRNASVSLTMCELTRIEADKAFEKFTQAQNEYNKLV